MSPPGGAVNLRTLEGRTVGDRYLLREWCGEGVFGGVFLSQQRLLGLPIRRVALKISKQVDVTVETAREVFADAFLLAEVMDSIIDAEARRHLVNVYDAGVAPEIGGRSFLAMEFVEGTTLAAQFASYGRVPAPLLMRWAGQACTALKGLHTLVPPVLHRDLKPDNVLLGIDRAVRLVDFGLAAKLLHLGYVPGVAGTLAYMAPETSRGESVPASDVYTLGMLLYEGLTGRRPFGHLVPPVGLPDALHGSWLYEVKRRHHVIPPSSLNNTVTPRIDAIVLGCLEFEPGKRYRDAGELLDELRVESTPLPPSGEALEDGRRLRSEGDLDGAQRALERGLSARPASRDDRFLLLRELGEVLDSAGQPSAAARHFVAAWELTERTTILRTRAERAALLGQAAACYRDAGNTFQARRYEDLAGRELAPRTARG